MSEHRHFGITPSELSNSFSKFKELVQWSLPIKLTLSALVGTLGGAGLLGYLSEYATYSYAIHFGIRPPLEGIPYLKATVAIGSFLLLLSSALFFALTCFLFRLLLLASREAANLVEYLFSKIWGRRQSRLHLFDHTHPLQPMTMLDVIPLLFVFMAFFSIVIPILDSSTVASFRESSFGKGITSIVILVVFGSYGAAVIFPAIYVRGLWWIGMIFTLLYFTVLVSLLFSPNQYSTFLRLIGYGGGLPVLIQLTDETPADINSSRELHLMLRTTEAFILYDNDHDKFVEIPKDQVRRITHASNGLQNLWYILP